MALSERLQWILDLDASGAIRASQRASVTIRGDLDKVDGRLNKMGGQMQLAGAGMVAFATIAGRGLYAMAQASETANLAQLKLANSVQNNPKLAGESTKAFTDLADSIEDVTAADGDAIIEGMAMLGTFRVTGDQLRELTPLVVDYARKFSVDMVAANAAVGKALDGQIGALKRQGVSIDENLFATDRYTAVMEALRTQVGGFAEAEGKTFSGQVQRMKNHVGELAEGIGVGVAGAFGDMIGVVDSAVDALNRISPETLSATGKTAAWGTAAIGTAGAVSFLTGSVLKAADNFKKLAGGVSSATQAMGGLKGMAGVAGVTTAVVAAGLAVVHLIDRLNEVETDVSVLARMTSDELLTTWRDWDALNHNVLSSTKNLIVGLAGFGLGMSDTEDKTATFNDVLKENPRLALEMAAAMLEAGEITKTEFEGIERAARGSAEANERGSEIAMTAAEAYEAEADSLQTVEDGLNRARDAHQALIDTQIAAIDEEFAYEEAVDSAEDAVRDYNEAMQTANETTGDEAVAAQEAASDSFRAARNALIDEARSATNLAIQQAAANGQTLSAEQKHRALIGVLQGVASRLAPGSALRVALDQYINRLRAVPTRIHTHFSQSGDAFARVGGVPQPRQLGGPVRAGMPFLVGERGPELFVPNKSGAIVPNGAGGNSGGGGPVVIQLMMDRRLFGEATVEGLTAWSRSNGPIPIKVS